MSKIQVVCPEVRQIKCLTLMSSWDVKFFLIFSFFFHYLLPSACEVFFVKKHSCWLVWSQVSVHGSLQLLECVTHKMGIITALKIHLLQSICGVRWGPVLTTFLFREKPTFPLKIWSLGLTTHLCLPSQRWWAQLASAIETVWVCWAHAQAAACCGRGTAARPAAAASSPSLWLCVTARNSCFVGVTAALHLLRSSGLRQSAESCRGATTAFMPLLMVLI